MTNHASTATTVHATEFLEANKIRCRADLPAGQWPADATPEQIADVMLANWTFDGAVTCDRDELVSVLAWLPARVCDDCSAELHAGDIVTAETVKHIDEDGVFEVERITCEVCQ